MKNLKVCAILLLIATSFSFITACTPDEKDEPQRTEQNDNPGNDKDNEDSGNEDSTNLGDILISNTSVKTYYSDFYFVTEIRVKLVPEIRNKRLKFDVVHGVPEEELGISLDNADPNNAEIQDIYTSMENGYQIVKMKFLGAIYFIMKQSWASDYGNWTDLKDYQSKLGDFMACWHEYNHRLEQVATSDFDIWSETELKDIIQDLKEYMDEMLTEALNDYCQNYFIIIDDVTYRVGYWEY